MKKIFFSVLLSISMLMGAELPENSTLSESEVAMIEKGILSEAIKSKDYETISSMAISFYITSNNPGYTGDAKSLNKRAVNLLVMCHNGGFLPSSSYLVVAFLKAEPLFSSKIAKESILQNANNTKARYTSSYVNMVMLYVSVVIDRKLNDKKEVNFALEAIQNLPSETVETKFYSAFLFSALGMDEIADGYLNDACHMARPGSTIFDYCMNADNVEKEDVFAKQVSNPECKADIGQRCK